MIATFKLLNSYFWKTYYGPILSFVFPVILLAILGNIFRIEYVYPGIIAMSFLFIGILALPLAIMELKQSSLFKYIGSSPVNPIKFSISVIFFYVIVALATTLIILAATMGIFKKDVFPHSGFKMGILGGIFASVAGVASFWIALLVHLFFVIIFGLLISTIAKTPQQSLTTGIIIIIPSMFLSGMILSVDIIGQSPALNWISRLIPFRYTTGNIVIASTPLNQVGDMFESLPSDQLSLIFKNVHNGEVVFNRPGHNAVHIKNMLDLKNTINGVGGVDNFAVYGLSDKTLFNLTFGEALKIGANHSDNNIFMWKHSWAVRRIPQVDAIKGFITDYFSSLKKPDGSLDTSKLVKFGTQISGGHFGWLEIFMKQTNVLYTQVDRVLNLLLPISVSGFALWYIGSNFQWSAR